MTADRDVEAVAAVLADHPGSERGQRGAWCVKCLCGHDTAVAPYPGDAWDAHRAHLAAALLPLIREREAAAWDLGYYRGVRDGTEDTDAATNPYAGSEGDDE